MSATSWALSAFVTAVLAFVFREVLIGATGCLAHRIIVLAVNRLPDDRRELRREEWLAEYDAIVAKGLHLAGLIHACGVFLGAVRIAHRGQTRSAIKRISLLIIMALRRPVLTSVVAGLVASTTALVADLATGSSSFIANFYGFILPKVEQILSLLLMLMSAAWSIRSVLHARSRKR